MDWLRIPSVSTDPAFDAETRAAGVWCVERLREAGFSDARLVETGPVGPDGRRGRGHPVVLAESAGAPGYAGPRVLFYGHYDVQPPDPVELWTSPPFEPVILGAEGVVGERVVARGAVDDKGQVCCFLEAMRALFEETGLAAGGAAYTVLIEGEEESGSVNLEGFVGEHREMLRRCDAVLISDTGMLDRGRPAITTGVRGLAYTEVVLHGPSHDLHSGQWGGAVPNPISELAKVIAQLWDADRRVTVPGFYEGVRGAGAGELASWKTLGVDEAAQLRSVGLDPAALPAGGVGERGFSMLERLWARPTAELNGIVGGYTGHGAKTVIPSKASAKVSFRLVDEQDPARVTAAFFAWCRARTPAGCRWEFIDHSGGMPAVVKQDAPLLMAAAGALREASGVEPAMIRTGGSIPVAGLLKRELGLETVFMGFGLDDDRVHSPNEKFEIACFELGIRAHTLLARRLANGPAGR